MTKIEAAFWILSAMFLGQLGVWLITDRFYKEQKNVERAIRDLIQRILDLEKKVDKKND